MFAVVAFFKKLGHCPRSEIICHYFCPTGKHLPGDIRSYDSIAYSYPNSGQPEIIAEFAGVSHEHDGRKISRSVSECGKPTSHSLF